MDAERVRFRDVLAITEFRALYLAQTLSVIGDQFARIAVASIVFARTGSALLTGVSYAISYLPWVIGGPMLAVVADRMPRRTVMIVCELGRLALILSAATPGIAIPLLFAATGLTSLLQPLFTAARAALIPEIVGGKEAYRSAATLTNVTLQLAVVVGFGAGGVATAAVGAHLTLLTDATTFGVSAASVLVFVKHRPAALTSRSSWRHDISAGAKTVFTSAYLRCLVTTSWLVVGVAIATEAAAVPYAHAHHGGAASAGMLSAALPLGTAIGALLFARITDDHTIARMLPALSCCTPLLLAVTGLDPQPVVAATIWMFAGACSATTVVANRLFVVGVPHEVRARAFGVAATGIAVAQGLGTLSVGLLASHTTPAHAICVTAMITLAMLMATTNVSVEALDHEHDLGLGIAR